AYGISYNCDEAPHAHGGYSEYIYLRPGPAVFKLEETLPTERVIGAGCALVTAIHGVERMGIEWGDTVVVQGAGPVGLAVLAVAVDRGAAKVIVVGGPEARLQTAKEFGASECVNIDERRSALERMEFVRHATRGFGADAVIECVGLPEVVPEGLEMVRDGGRLLVLGHYGDAGTVPFNPHWITRKQLTVLGAWGSEQRHMDLALKFLRNKAGRFPFERLVTHRFRLDQASQAIETTARWQSTKSVIVPHL
ncbi:MAG: zinc-binding dehydrogenase, partial [Acidobacteriota bacterium]